MREVAAPEAVRLAVDGYRILDVRELVEWNAGRIPGATLVPLAEFAARIGDVAPDRSQPLLVHCAHGVRSNRAARHLDALGYRDVVSLRDSLAGWRAAGGAWEGPVSLLTEAQQRRYSRQLLMPEIGAEGQRRLLDSRVLLVGAGGLGSPAALYLAAAGLGSIGLVDDGAVEESNLQRQVLHTTDRIGMGKTASARTTLAALNPEVHVTEHPEHLDAGNVERLIGDYHVIVDGSDNFETRYVLNDAAVRLRRPLVHGSVYRWDGQITTILPFDGPCYRCIFPAPPPPELAPDCAVAGVAGVLPGLIGVLQATEVLKLRLGVGETLAGRLLTIDAAGATFSEVRVARDPACPACGIAAAERVPLLPGAAARA